MQTKMALETVRKKKRRPSTKFRRLSCDNCPLTKTLSDRPRLTSTLDALLYELAHRHSDISPRKHQIIIVGPMGADQHSTQRHESSKVPGHPFYSALSRYRPNAFCASLPWIAPSPFEDQRTLADHSDRLQYAGKMTFQSRGPSTRAGFW